MQSSVAAGYSAAAGLPHFRRTARLSVRTASATPDDAASSHSQIHSKAAVSDQRSLQQAGATPKGRLCTFRASPAAEFSGLFETPVCKEGVPTHSNRDVARGSIGFICTCGTACPHTRAPLLLKSLSQESDPRLTFAATQLEWCNDDCDSFIGAYLCTLLRLC